MSDPDPDSTPDSEPTPVPDADPTPPSDADRPPGDADPDADLAWERRDSRVAYTCPGFDVVHDEVRLPDGTPTDYDYVSEPPAVVVVPFRPNGRVVVIDEWRQAVDRVNRGLPAGGVEPGETPAEAARRELREETGYRAGDLEPLLTTEPANGIADSVHHQFVARDCVPAGDQDQDWGQIQDLDHDEQIRVDTADFDALHQAVLRGEIQDGRAAFAVLACAALGAAPEQNGL